MALHRSGRIPDSGTGAGSKVSAMRAILRSRMLTAVVAALGMAMLIGFPAVAQTDPPMKKQAVATQSRCKPLTPSAPCVGPLQSEYAYDGYGVGNTTSIHVKAGPMTVVGKVYKSTPVPGFYQVKKRTFTWHSPASVTIVAVYIERRRGLHVSYQRISTGTHSGHTTLTLLEQSIPPTLYLEGRKG